MSTEIDRATRTPEEWCRLTGWKILDPDGWDRSNFAEDWARPLTHAEFERKAMMSTAMAPDAQPTVRGGYWEGH